MDTHPTDPSAIERRLAQTAEDERHDRRAFLRTLALLVFWPALGVVGMGWGFQMDDLVRGQAVFYASAALANLGILGTLFAAYDRAD